MSSPYKEQSRDGPPVDVTNQSTGSPEDVTSLDQSDTSWASHDGPGQGVY